MTRIGILGDTHGDTRAAVAALNLHADKGIGTIFQAGDFGIYPTDFGVEFLETVDATLKDNDQTLFVAPGNHEDYDYIESIPVSDDGLQHIGQRINLAPRGFRKDFGGRSVLFLGGAPSVDRWYRTTHHKVKSWWAQEALTDEDVRKVIEGGQADVMITHDAPFGAPTVEYRIRDNPFGFTDADLQYAREGRIRMRDAFMAAQPKLFVHGHYHFLADDVWNVPSAPFTRDIRFTCHMVGLDCNSHNNSVGELDTDTLDVTIYDLFKEYA
jgi:Icc-related predicted phosphoesterase